MDELTRGVRSARGDKTQEVDKSDGLDKKKVVEGMTQGDKPWGVKDKGNIVLGGDGQRRGRERNSSSTHTVATDSEGTKKG